MVSVNSGGPRRTLAGMPEALVDTFGRQARDLRISITDRCNFRCTYCMPSEGMVWLDREELLTYEEQARVARLCVERFGFEAVRITGGEPTCGPTCPGWWRCWPRWASTWPSPPTGCGSPSWPTTSPAAGLGRVNVSLDSLRRDRSGP